MNALPSALCASLFLCFATAARADLAPLLDRVAAAYGGGATPTALLEKGTTTSLRRGTGPVERLWARGGGDGDRFRILVEAAPADRAVRVVVEDDGPGLPPEEIARMFTPFYTTKTRGMGLGLPLAKRIVERFGGDIGVSSEPGCGTRVELTLPAAR